MSDAETPTPPPPPASEGAPPPPPPADTGSGSGSGSGVSDNRNVMIVLSYLWILALIPLLVEKDDKEVQWHAKHGLVLLVAEFVIQVALGVVAIGCVVGPLLALVFLIIHIVCIVKGVNGERFLIPGLSQFADKF